MRRVVLIPLAVLLLSGCKESTTPGSFPDIEGVYATTFSTTFANTFEFESDTSSGTVTLSKPDGQGRFTGTFVIEGSGGGIVRGTVASDGVINIGEFRDYDADPIEDWQYLAAVYYWCRFDGAGSPMSGSVSGRELTLSTNLTMTCNYSNPSQSVASQLAFALKGTRP